MRLSRAWLITTLAGVLLTLPAAPSLAQKPGDTFQSPLKNFTIPVPQMNFGTKVEKRNSKDEGSVSFIGGAGDSRRIEYVRLPPNAPALSNDEQQAGYERMLRGLVESNKNSAIVMQKPYVLDDVPMLMAVVSFPGGSHLMDQRTRKHLDSTRGLLFVARNGFLYVLHYELTDGLFGLLKGKPESEGTGKAELGVDELTRRAERTLPQFYRSITFK
jgi:hypothetical protein